MGAEVPVEPAAYARGECGRRLSTAGIGRRGGVLRQWHGKRACHLGGFGPGDPGRTTRARKPPRCLRARVTRHAHRGQRRGERINCLPSSRWRTRRSAARGPVPLDHRGGDGRVFLVAGVHAGRRQPEHPGDHALHPLFELADHPQDLPVAEELGELAVEVGVQFHPGGHVPRLPELGLGGEVSVPGPPARASAGRPGCGRCTTPAPPDLVLLGDLLDGQLADDDPLLGRNGDEPLGLQPLQGGLDRGLAHARGSRPVAARTGTTRRVVVVEQAVLDLLVGPVLEERAGSGVTVGRRCVRTTQAGCHVKLRRRPDSGRVSGGKRDGLHCDPRQSPATHSHGFSVATRSWAGSFCVAPQPCNASARVGDGLLPKDRRAATRKHGPTSLAKVRLHLTEISVRYQLRFGHPARIGSGRSGGQPHGPDSPGLVVLACGPTADPADPARRLLSRPRWPPHLRRRRPRKPRPQAPHAGYGGGAAILPRRRGPHRRPAGRRGQRPPDSVGHRLRGWPPRGRRRAPRRGSAPRRSLRSRRTSPGHGRRRRPSGPHRQGHRPGHHGLRPAGPHSNPRPGRLRHRRHAARSPDGNCRSLLYLLRRLVFAKIIRPR